MFCDLQVLSSGLSSHSVRQGMRHEKGCQKRPQTQVEVSQCYEEALWGERDKEDREVMVGILICSHNFIKGTKFLEEVAEYK